MTDTEILDFLSCHNLDRRAHDVQIGDVVVTFYPGKSLRDCLIHGIERHVSEKIAAKLLPNKEPDYDKRSEFVKNFGCFSDSDDGFWCQVPPFNKP